jgi:hypothetical protein
MEPFSTYRRHARLSGVESSGRFNRYYLSKDAFVKRFSEYNKILFVYIQRNVVDRCLISGSGSSTDISESTIFFITYNKA